MFPQRLDSSVAYDIAKAMMDGFNRHYQLFRGESASAKQRFETADWHGQQRAQRERIEFYDLRVREASTSLERDFKAGEQTMDVWQQVSCTTSACWSTTSSLNWPRRFSIQSLPRSCTAATFKTTLSLCDQLSVLNILKTVTPMVSPLIVRTILRWSRCKLQYWR